MRRERFDLLEPLGAKLTRDLMGPRGHHAPAQSGGGLAAARYPQAAVILSAMPVGTNPYVIAQQYDVHIETVSPAIIISTGMSVATVFIILIWYGVG
jgi:predicted permease